MPTVSFSRSAELTWQGDVVHGAGIVKAATGAFEVPATFPTLRGEEPGATTPEELLAASHAVCYGIGLRSVLARNGGSAARIVTTATITGEKGAQGIRVTRSHLSSIITGLEGVEPSRLNDIGTIVEQECTISTAIRNAVAITYEVVSE
jgi:osmotically inducible protein OsmC